jgi:hypothetical protein
MRRAWLIVVGGLVLALAAYFGAYYACTARSHSLESTNSPELAWLKDEFHLTNEEFARINQMHEAYLAGCAERCRRIDEKNADLKRLLASTNAVTPQIEQTLGEAARLRAECQKQMLQHFYEVSRTMPEEQGKRYLDWVQAQTILSDTHSQMQASAPMPMHMHGHH